MTLKRNKLISRFKKHNFIKSNNRNTIFQRCGVLGFSQEGKAVLKYLKKSAKYKNADIKILDKKFDKNYLKNLKQFDIIFRSPGVPYNLPEIQNAIKKGVKISSSTKLFFEEAKKIGCKIIGITGTKGKGTTSTLLYKILKTANNKNVFLAGNIGKPAIELLPKLKKNSTVILELSSFQLQDLKQSPQIAVILNIFEDHLDSHKNFKEYLYAKANITKYQKKSDKVFYGTDNKWSRLLAQKSLAKKIAVNASSSRGWRNVLKKNLKLPGEHNFKNILMAAMVAKSLGIAQKTILKTVRNYRGMEHHLELVNSNIPKNVGIKFYNDSASTNPYATAAAIRAFPNQLKILIAGGKDKNLNYSPLAKALKNSNTKLVVLFGENKYKIKRQIANSSDQKSRICDSGRSKAPIVLTKNLKIAVDIAYQKSKSYKLKTKSSIIILFSPASASFDMFKNYKERGEKFKALVKKLK